VENPVDPETKKHCTLMSRFQVKAVERRQRQKHQNTGLKNTKEMQNLTAAPYCWCMSKCRSQFYTKKKVEISGVRWHWRWTAAV